MVENLLILHPGKPNEYPAQPQQLISVLQQEGFIANAVDLEGEQHFVPGEEFMMLVTFLGCSPVIAMGEAGATGDEFCHIAFEGPLPQPKFYSGDNAKIPRCPHCGQRHDTWQEQIAKWSADTATVTCPACGQQTQPYQLRWRKSAGFARFCIKIWGIFESEAVPSPNLLALLHRTTGLEWQHFYVRHQG